MKIDYRLSDKARNEFILDCVRLTAKVELMAALDNLKLALRRVREKNLLCWWCDTPLTQDEIDEGDHICDKCYQQQFFDRDELNPFYRP